MASVGVMPPQRCLSEGTLGSLGKEASATSPRTPSPTVDRSVLTATPTPLRRQGGAASLGPTRPPRYVYYALRAEDDPEIGFSALSPEEAVEPSDALGSQLVKRSQFLFTTSSPEAALFFAETAGGPGFANGGAPRSASKRVVVKIDLSGFKGEVLDISTVAGCDHYGVPKNSRAWNFAMDHQMVLLVGYVPPRLVAAQFDLELSPLPMRSPRSASARQILTLDGFTASLPGHVKNVLAGTWAGHGDQRLSCPAGVKTRDQQGLVADARSRATAFWDVKQRLDEEMRRLEARRQRLAPQLEVIMDWELAACADADAKARASGLIGPVDESLMLVMKGWRCIEEYPFWAASTCVRQSEVQLRGTTFQTRLALTGQAGLEEVRRVAGNVNPGTPCKHCLATKPVEFHLLRNVGLDGANVTWPPYFRLFCFDNATEELEELLNTCDGSPVRDCEHPHVFPSDEVGFAFPLDRVPVALAALEATLPSLNVEQTDEVALPQRPLYLVLVVPHGAPSMQSLQGGPNDSAPLYVPRCGHCA